MSEVNLQFAGCFSRERRLISCVETGPMAHVPLARSVSSRTARLE